MRSAVFFFLPRATLRFEQIRQNGAHVVNHQMVKFGEQLEIRAIPEWREAYVSYAKLKRLLKQLPTGGSGSFDEEEVFREDSMALILLIIQREQGSM